MYCDAEEEGRRGGAEVLVVADIGRAEDAYSGGGAMIPTEPVENGLNPEDPKRLSKLEPKLEPKLERR